MYILLKDQNGKRCTLEVDQSETVARVKWRLLEKHGVSHRPDLTLLHSPSHQLMQNCCTLSDYSVVDGDTLRYWYGDRRGGGGGGTQQPPIIYTHFVLLKCEHNSQWIFVYSPTLEELHRNICVRLHIPEELQTLVDEETGEPLTMAHLDENWDTAVLLESPSLLGRWTASPLVQRWVPPATRAYQRAWLLVARRIGAPWPAQINDIICGYICTR